MKTKLVFKILFLSLLVVIFTANAKKVRTPGGLYSSKPIKMSDTSSDRTLSPYFFINSDNPAVDKLPLKLTEAKVNITGVIADVTVIQEYANEGINPIEAIYVFPASTRAAVYFMKMSIGERTIIAKIAEREKARHDYEQAKNSGKSASLLEQQRPNVFQMNVANIMPGDKVKVELRYTELLVPDDGIYHFVYPTVVGPRYSNRNSNEVPSTEHWVSNPYTHEKEKPAYLSRIECSINAGMPISDIQCRSHKTSILYKGMYQADLILDASESQGGDRDFLVDYKLAGNKMGTGLLLYPGEKENFFLAMIQPPQKVSLSEVPPREYVFIMDVSGSMYGYPINISKSLLHNLISSLRASDRFNVMLFAGSNRLFSEQSVPATSENLGKAIAFIDKENGGGGTELLPALQRALSMKGSEGFSRSFIIATDGYVDVEKAAFDLIRHNLDKANFFPFGIGTSVNRYLIEGMAHAGAGLPFIITEEAKAETEASRFIHYIQNPVLSHIKATFQGFEAYDVEPTSVQDVFSDRPVIIIGKYRGAATGTIRINGISSAGKFENILEVNSYKPVASNGALRYLWARECIRNLDDFNRDGDENKEQVTRLGLEYNLLTRYTSFLAIDSEIKNREGNPTTINQPLPLPEGVSDYAISSIQFTPPVIRSDLEMNKTTIKETDRKTAGDFPMKTEVIEEDFDIPSSIVEEMPEFPGGNDKLEQFLANNIVYPRQAIESAIQGSVYLTFVVKQDGTITDIKVLRGIGGGCDEEAIRVIKLMPKWIPGKQNGKLVPVHFNLPVQFKLQVEPDKH